MSNNSNLFYGIFWSSIEVIIKRILDIVVKLILARLLFPEDFGVVGMAVVFTSFIQVLNDSGMAMAIIQRKKDNLKEIHFHTAFWTGIIWAILLYLFITLLVAPFATYFYGDPLLKQIIPILGLSVLFSSVNSIHRAQLMRDLKFKKLAFVNNFSSIFSGIVAVVLAFLGWGVWSLVIYTVLVFIIAMPLLFIATKWTPQLKWEKQAFRDIFGFGVFTTGTKVVQNISSNIDYLIIGKLVSASALGAYSLAYMLTSMVMNQVTSMLNRVLFPFYSSIQTDLEKVKEYYLNVIKYYGIIIYPIMLTLILLGEEVILYFFGEKWIDTIVPLKLLAIAVLVDVFTSVYNLLFRSVGKVKIEMMTQIYTSLFIYIPLILIGGIMKGVIGVALAILVSKILSFIFFQFLLNKYFNIKFLDLFISLKPAIISFIITYIFIFSLVKYLDINLLILILILIITSFAISGFFIKKDILHIKDKYLNKNF